MRPTPPATALNAGTPEASIAPGAARGLTLGRALTAGESAGCGGKKTGWPGVDIILFLIISLANRTAVFRAAAAADPKAFSSVSTGEELRDILVDLDGEKGPLLFCAKELRGFLEEASRRYTYLLKILSQKKISCLFSGGKTTGWRKRGREIATDNKQIRL